MTTQTQRQELVDLFSRTKRECITAAQNYASAWAEHMAVGIAATNAHVAAIPDHARGNPLPPSFPPMDGCHISMDELIHRIKERSSNLLAALDIN